MTLLCGGLHNKARVPEFRLPVGKRLARNRNSGKQFNTRHPGGEAYAAPRTM